MVIIMFCKHKRIILVTGPDSSRVLRSQHTDLRCRR